MKKNNYLYYGLVFILLIVCYLSFKFYTNSNSPVIMSYDFDVSNVEHVNSDSITFNNEDFSLSIEEATRDESYTVSLKLDCSDSLYSSLIDSYSLLLGYNDRLIKSDCNFRDDKIVDIIVSNQNNYDTFNQIIVLENKTFKNVLVIDL